VSNELPFPVRLRTSRTGAARSILRGATKQALVAYFGDTAEVWEGDLDAALSHFEPLPNKGPEALQDSTNYVRVDAHP
jgi:hypothetical protein